jgi:hypothetical protein
VRRGNHDHDDEVAAHVITACAGTAGPLRWAIAGSASRGEEVSGDRWVATAADDGALIAVIDGLGHGRQAAAAADEAVRALERAPSSSVLDAMLACHRALARTRGAVVSIVRVHAGALTWTGVGNVEAVLVRGPNSALPRGRLLLAGGVVGHSLPLLRPSGHPVARGDLIVLGTDGLGGDFPEHIDATAPPERVVDRLLARARPGHDDALALAARYDGAPP